MSKTTVQGPVVLQQGWKYLYTSNPQRSPWNRIHCFWKDYWILHWLRPTRTTTDAPRAGPDEYIVWTLTKLKRFSARFLFGVFTKFQSRKGCIMSSFCSWDPICMMNVITLPCMNTMLLVLFEICRYVCFLPCFETNHAVMFPRKLQRLIYWTRCTPESILPSFTACINIPHSWSCTWNLRAFFTVWEIVSENKWTKANRTLEHFISFGHERFQL